MKTNDILMILISIILCGVSIYILIRNKEKKSKKLIVYCIIGMFLVMIDACMLQFFYHDNAIYKNFRMIALLSIMASVAYVDFTELRIPNEYIITGLVYWVLSIFVELICSSQFIVANIISSLIAAAALFIASLLCKICIRGSIGAGDIFISRFIIYHSNLFSYYKKKRQKGCNGIWPGSCYRNVVINIFDWNVEDIQ